MTVLCSKLLRSSSASSLQRLVTAACSHPPWPLSLKSLGKRADSSAAVTAKHHGKCSGLQHNQAKFVQWLVFHLTGLVGMQVSPMNVAYAAAVQATIGALQMAVMCTDRAHKPWSVIQPRNRKAARMYALT